VPLGLQQTLRQRFRNHRGHLLHKAENGQHEWLWHCHGRRSDFGGLFLEKPAWRQDSLCSMVYRVTRVSPVVSHLNDSLLTKHRRDISAKWAISVETRETVTELATQVSACHPFNSFKRGVEQSYTRFRSISHAPSYVHPASFGDWGVPRAARASVVWKTQSFGG